MLGELKRPHACIAPSNTTAVCSIPVYLAHILVHFLMSLQSGETEADDAEVEEGEEEDDEEDDDENSSRPGRHRKKRRKKEIEVERIDERTNKAILQVMLEGLQERCGVDVVLKPQPDGFCAVVEAGTCKVCGYVTAQSTAC